MSSSLHSFRIFRGGGFRGAAAGSPARRRGKDVAGERLRGGFADLARFQSREKREKFDRNARLSRETFLKEPRTRRHSGRNSFLPTDQLSRSEAFAEMPGKKVNLLPVNLRNSKTVQPFGRCHRQAIPTGALNNEFIATIVLWSIRAKNAETDFEMKISGIPELRSEILTDLSNIFQNPAPPAGPSSAPIREVGDSSSNSAAINQPCTMSSLSPSSVNPPSPRDFGRHPTIFKESCLSLAVIDCVVSPWGPWSECDAECGTGMTTRHREIQVQPQNGGKHCPSLMQKRGCQGTKCPHHMRNVMKETAMLLPIGLSWKRKINETADITRNLKYTYLNNDSIQDTKKE